MDEFSRILARIAPSVNKEQLELMMAQPLRGKRMDIPCDGRIVETWFHRAASPGAPVLFEMHGGGFVFGNAVKTDGFRQKICLDGDINVVGIDYRKAPENRYPAALEDVLDVIRWFWNNAGQLSLDRDSFFVCGESAGGNLAAAAANRLTTDSSIRIQGQILHYPFLDMTEVCKAYYPNDFPEEVSRAFIELYCDEEHRREPSASPVFATPETLAHSAAALIVTAELDSLKATGRKYAEMLQSSGTAVRYLEMPGAHHGYIEDWFCPACYGLLSEQEKKHHSSDFGELAELAVVNTIVFIRKALEK